MCTGVVTLATEMLGVGLCNLMQYKDTGSF